MPKRTKDYRTWLLARLTNPEEASRYLNVAKSDSRDVFLNALRNVAEANRMSEVAGRADVNRESLYRALSKEGNPTLNTLDSVLGALGLKIVIEPAKFFGPELHGTYRAADVEFDPTVEVVASAGVTLEGMSSFLGATTTTPVPNPGVTPVGVSYFLGTTTTFIGPATTPVPNAIAGAVENQRGFSHNENMQQIPVGMASKKSQPIAA